MANKVIDLLSDRNKLKKISEEQYNSIGRYYIEDVKEKWISLLEGKYE